MTQSLSRTVREIIHDPVRYSAQAAHVRLRPYQVPVIRAIVDSIRKQSGLTFVVIFSRQGGKNETQLSLYSYLLTAFQKIGGDIIHVEPTYKPQTQTSMARLEARLQANILTRGRWRKRFGYVYQVGNARAVHLSGDEAANVVGGTAGLLLSVNEAQDITTQKFDKDFAPMGASVNATRVFWGTRWPDSLLERELKAALAAQEKDGRRRVFIVDAEAVGRTVPPYRQFVAQEVARLGRQHPLIKTQYFCETIEEISGMFPPARLMLMRGSHPMRETPEDGKMYAFLIDVGGQDEKSINPNELDNPARDSTALTIIEIDPETIPTLQKPTYKTVFRRKWTGEQHTRVFGAITALYDLWRPVYIIPDATGVGEGLWSMLNAKYGPEKVIPVKFSESKKSEIGYAFIAIVETGRYRDYSPFDDLLLEQCQKCRAEARPGPSKSLRWGVPESTRRADGTYLHDDELLSAALCAELDALEWAIQTDLQAVEGFDPLDTLKGF